MKKIFIFLSFLAFPLITSCSTIDGYRQDPDTWGVKKSKNKKVESEKYENKEYLPAPIKLTLPESPDVEVYKKINKAPIQTIENLPSVKPHPEKVSVKTKKKGRTILGMIEPNVTQLPENKDLQESNMITPSITPIMPTLPDMGSPLVPKLSDPSFRVPSALPDN